MDLDAIISLQKHTIDGLRAELARVTNERREYWRERLIADGVLVSSEQLRARVAELDEKAERYRLTTLRQDATIAELVAALRDVRASLGVCAPSILRAYIEDALASAESATCQKATNPSQISSESATPGLRTDNPMAEPVMGGLPRYDGEKLGTPAKQHSAS